MLIRWASAARRVEPDKHKYTGVEVKTTMVPVLTIAMVNADAGTTLVAIDGKTYTQTRAGALTYVPNVSDIDTINADVQGLLTCISQLHSSEVEPNLLLLNDDILTYVRKVVPVKSIAFDLLGGLDELVQLNGTAMPIEKAKALLMNDKDSLVASMLFDESAQQSIQVVMSIMSMLEKYRSIVSGNVYATKFATGQYNFYVVSKNDAQYGTVATFDGSVIETKSYDKIFDVLKSETLIASEQLYTAVSMAFSEQLKSENSMLSVRKQVIEGIVSERKQYEALLDRIINEEKELSELSDANPEKTKQLASLKSKTQEKLALITEELDKLAK
jgi:hypothetical protein